MEGGPRSAESSSFGDSIKELRKWNRDNFSRVISKDALAGFVILRSELKRITSRCPELQRDGEYS
jgi:hypothetical protein